MENVRDNLEWVGLYPSLKEGDQLILVTQNFAFGSVFGVYARVTFLEMISDASVLVRIDEIIEKGLASTLQNGDETCKSVGELYRPKS